MLFQNVQTLHLPYDFDDALDPEMPVDAGNP
jgi:hypothetical protein